MIVTERECDLAKTTERHFELFKEHFAIYADMFGLHDWAVFFFHEKLENALACITTNPRMRDRCVSVWLNTEWGEIDGLSDQAIIRCACHEALEVLVDDICKLAEAGFKTEDETALARHVLIRRLEKVV